MRIDPDQENLTMPITRRIGAHAPIARYYGLLYSAKLQRPQPRPVAMHHTNRPSLRFGAKQNARSVAAIACTPKEAASESAFLAYIP